MTTLPAGLSPNPRVGPARLSIPDVTLPEFVFGQAHRYGDKRALIEVSTGREASHRQLAIAVQAVAAGLMARGVTTGDVVGVCAPNGIDFVTAVHGAMVSGATVTMLNPLAAPWELRRQLRRAGVRTLVTTVALYAEKLAAVARSEQITDTYLIGDAGDDIRGACGFEALAAIGRERLSAADEVEALGRPNALVTPSDVALLPFSGGTTGMPKGVMLTHRSLVVSISQTATAHRATEQDVGIVALPLSHIYAFQATLNPTLRAGGTVVIPPAYEIGTFLEAIERFGVTRAEVVPPMVKDLADSPLVAEHDLSSLRVILSCAAPLGFAVADACSQRIGCKVKQAFGMTELAGGALVAPDDGPDWPWLVGPALPGVECRVLDPETGSDRGVGEPGELLVRAANLMSGYLNDPDATAAAIDVDGWLHTGDIVTVDEHGWFRVVDRIKELIKVRGAQVVPAELEDLLLSHPAVSDAAVVGIPDEETGERPKAFIVSVGPVTKGELSAWVADKVSPYKRIDRIEFIDQIPRSAAGKILRRSLVGR